jgi:glutathione synthase/RimK-type ligase-like ATP-grasp enzyme
MILIISNKWDITVDFVVAELRKRESNFLRINTEDLVVDGSTIYLPDFKILVSKHGKKYDLTDSVNVIWNRRPGKPFDDIDPLVRPSQATQNFVSDQWFSWLEALQLIPDVTWVNHPQANDAMESKPRQLLLASKIGFLIPKTIISNEPINVRIFARENSDKLIVKALYSPLIEETEQDYFVFTNEIREIDLVSEEEIKISQSIFQQSLGPKIDYRVTVIGEKVFPVKICNRKGGKISDIDWRTEKEELAFSPCELPHEIENMCRKIVSDSGLIFGAIDLVQHDGEYYFLEINPNGEWGWLQHPHDVPIANALCDVFVAHDRKKAL